MRHNDAPVEWVLESVPPGLVWVGPTSASALAIEVTPSLVDFETDVKLAVVRLRYTDADNGIDERKTLQFMAGSAEPTTWTVERVDESARTISYTIDYIHHDNRRTKEVVEAWEDSLVILDPSLAS